MPRAPEHGAVAAGPPDLRSGGGLAEGREFAAKYADSIIAGANGNKAKKEFRDDIRRRAARYSRNPDDIKVLFLFAPVMGETEAGGEGKIRSGVWRSSASSTGAWG